jgi:hypothetical protein
VVLDFKYLSFRSLNILFTISYTRMAVYFPLSYKTLLPIDTVSSCENDFGMNESTTALVNIQFFRIATEAVLLQYRHHPRELSKLSFVIIGSGYAESHTLDITSAASFTRRWTWSSLVIDRLHVRNRTANL